MKKITLILLLFTYFLGHAQSNNELNTFIRDVISYSPLLKGQNNMTKIGELKTLIQTSFAKPIIGFETGITRIDPVSKASFGGNSAPMVLQFQPNMNYSTQFFANQVLYDWGKNSVMIEKSKLETQLSSLQIDQQRINLGYAVANIYHQIIFLRKALEIQKNELERIKNHLLITQKQVELGEALEFDKINSQIKASNQETKLIETENIVKKLSDYLLTLVGQEKYTLLFSAQSVILPSSTKSNIVQNNTIQQLNAEEAVILKDIQVANSSSLPTISGMASLGVRNGFVPRVNGETPPFADDFKLNSMVGIKLNVPIYSGKRATMQMNIAKLQQEKIRYQLADAEEKLNYEIRQANINLSTLQAKASNQSKLVEQSKYAYKLAESRLKQGLLRNIELDQVQNQLEEAQLAEANLSYLITIQELELLKIQGIKFWDL